MKNTSVRLNSTDVPAVVRYFKKEDANYLEAWRSCVGDDPNPVRRDAFDFAQSAHNRWLHDRNRYCYAYAQEDIGLFTRDNPQAEVCNYILLSCDSFPGPSKVIGIAHFRRTWCNNLILDYLSVNPLVAKPDEGPVVKGVGTELILFIIRTALSLNCGMLWGETTQNSYEWYQRNFSLRGPRDLLLIRRNSLKVFLEIANRRPC